MADEKFTFEQARIRLEEIASEARKKDTSLERSLDLLEEGVRLANICTELVDHTDLDAHVEAPASELSVEDGGQEPLAGEASEPSGGDDPEGSAPEDASGDPDGDEMIGVSAEVNADVDDQSSAGDDDDIEEPLLPAD